MSEMILGKSKIDNIENYFCNHKDPRNQPSYYFNKYNYITTYNILLNSETKISGVRSVNFTDLYVRKNLYWNCAVQIDKFLPIQIQSDITNIYERLTKLIPFY